MKVAALQMVSSTRLSANLEAAYELLSQAAAQGAELAVLPEYFCQLGQTERDKLTLQEALGQGPIQNFLSSAARQLKLWIVGGTLPLTTLDPAHARNTSLVFAPNGECIARYDKIHLFRFNQGEEDYDESRTLQAGGEPVSFDLHSADGATYKIGLSICYDLRFPELYRRLQSDVLLVPSAFTYTTGQAHWEILLRARAIENLAYVVAAAQGGKHENGRRTWGHSMVIDPWGHILAQQAEGAAVVLADITHERLQAIRAQLPALNHRSL